MGLALNDFKSLLLKFSVKLFLNSVYYNIEFFGPPI